MDNLITYKIATIYPEMESKPLHLSYINKATGIHSYMDKHGSDFTKNLDKGETAATVLLSQRENFTYQNRDEKRVYATLSYVPIEEEGKITDNFERAKNMFNRKVHSFIKRHPDVKIKDVNGNNINENQGSMVQFELIEESADIKKQHEKNNLVSKYRYILSEMFENRREAFIDICYALGVKNILQTPAEKLYNEVLLKININPDEFKKVHEHKKLDLLTLLKKGMSLTVDPISSKTLITEDGGVYFLDDEVIGKTEEEVIHFLETNPKKKDFIMMHLGIKDTGTLPPLPATAEALPKTNTQLSVDAIIDAQRIKEMNNAVAAMANKVKTMTKKAPANAGDFEREFLLKVVEKRTEFMDVVDAYDAKIIAAKQELGLN